MYGEVNKYFWIVQIYFIIFLKYFLFKIILMKSVNERLRFFLDNRHVDQSQLARQLTVNKQTINNWVTDTSIPMGRISELLVMFSDLNARWLLTGQGEMLNGGVNIPELLEEPKAAYKNNCCELCKEKDKRIEDKDSQIEDLKRINNWLQNQIDAKKETGAANSVQFRQAANE
jgi:transcriptional regulator with XRE-family HTH domain